MHWLSCRLRLPVLLLFAAFLPCGCGEWLDVNVNPNDLSEETATPDLVLPGALHGMGSDVYQSQFYFLNHWMGYWCPPFSQAGTPEQTYNLLPNPIYLTGPGISLANNLQLVEDKARRTGQTFYVGIAKITKSMLFANLVDLYNNVPYSQALQGSQYDAPRYDDGQRVYEQLMVEIDSGINLVKTAEISRNPRLSQADVLFGGNKDKWVRFANTLRLRLLVHQANRANRREYILREVARINAEGSGFLGSGEDAAVSPGYSSEDYNPLFMTLGFYQGEPSFNQVYAGEAALNFLKANQDPRLNSFYNPAEAPLPDDAQEPFPQPAPREFRGNRYGLPTNPLLYPYQAPPYISRVGGRIDDGPVTDASYGFFKGYDMDSWILTSVESLFLQAEAVQRGWLPGDPKEAYLAAVKESFRWLNVGRSRQNPALSDAAFEAWYEAQDQDGNPNVSWDDAPDPYKLLMFQKYLAMNTVAPLEAWTDYRRNDAYPVIPLSADPGRTSPVLPVRLPYPLSDYFYNAENVREQGEINIFTDKIWWMP